MKYFYCLLVSGILSVSAACAMDGAREESWQDVLRGAVDAEVEQRYATPAGSSNGSGFATPRSETPQIVQEVPGQGDLPVRWTPRFNREMSAKIVVGVAVAVCATYLIARSSWGKAAWNRLKAFKNSALKRFKKSSQSA